MSGDQRVRKVLAAMDRAGLDALIAVSGDVHAFQQPNAVMLLTGFRAIGMSYVVLRSDGELTLTVSPAWEADRAAAARAQPARRERTTFAHRSPPPRASRLPAARKIGIVGLDTLGYDDARWLTQMLGERGRIGSIRKFLARDAAEIARRNPQRRARHRGCRAGLRAAARTGAAGRQRDRSRGRHLRRDGGRRR